MRLVSDTCLALLFCSLSFAAEKPESILRRLKLPAGLQLSLYAENVPNARSMTLGPDGIVFVGTRESNLYALIPDKSRTKAAEVITLAKNLETPNGVAFHGGDLYVGLVDKILRYDRIKANLRSLPKPVAVFDKLPGDKHHGWKFIAFGPDGKLYIPVGAPCNICKRDEPIYAAIHRLDLKTKTLELVASGVRNTVGFDWHPQTRELWFTDNGRDMLGDDLPPDELNRVTKIGQHFGYPFCHGTDIKDPEFGKERGCQEFVKPEATLDAHAAALGMRFYTGKALPKGIYFAQHGSWNRSHPIGYRVMHAALDGNKITRITPFVEGWLQGEEVLGRPVDVLPMADGSLLISDDKLGVVYRVGPQKSFQ